MSHELRTPLNAIGGYAELLEMGVHGPVTPDQRIALERIQRSQRHLLGLINGVLNYAKIDAGVVSYDLADIVLSELLATSEALTAPQLKAKGLVFHFDGCNPRHTARADGEKVQQIVLNLLSNAIKFTDAGGRITMTCVASDNGMVMVRVADSGRGIAPDQFDLVFQPFVQVDVTLTRTKEGTGLGLAISRDLVARLNSQTTRAMGRMIMSAILITASMIPTTAMPRPNTTPNMAMPMTKSTKRHGMPTNTNRADSNRNLSVRILPAVWGYPHYGAACVPVPTTCRPDPAANSHWG